MAPEFVRHTKSPKTDAWALGVTTAWMMGSFSLPENSREEWILPKVWDDESEKEKMERWLALVEETRKGLTGCLGGLVAEMLEPDPERRLGCKEVLSRLDQEA